MRIPRGRAQKGKNLSEDESGREKDMGQEGGGVKKKSVFSGREDKISGRM